jgi:hypothetical protein
MTTTENNPLATHEGLVTWLNGRRTVGCKGECLLSQYILHVTGRRACVLREEWWFRDDPDLHPTIPMEPWATALTRAYDQLLVDHGGDTAPAILVRALVARTLSLWGLDASGLKP